LKQNSVLIAGASSLNKFKMLNHKAHCSIWHS